MAISFITTVRITEERRARNLWFTVDWHQRYCDWEWVIIEQDIAPRLDAFPLPPGLKRLFVVNPGPFNKSWGFNVGARVARGDLLYFCDADLVVAEPSLKTTVSLCTEPVLAVNPYDALADLDQKESDALLAGESLPRFDCNDVTAHRGDGEALCFCSGAFLLRRSLHQQMGGFDERYPGWCGEDLAMAVRLVRTTARVAVVEGSIALRLWGHREPAIAFDNPHYQASLAHLDELQAMSDRNFRFMRDVQRQIMGNPGKYEPISSSPP